MNRRAMLVVSGTWLILATARSFGQAPNAIRRIALVSPGTEKGYRSYFDAFLAAMKDLGYVDGRNVSMEVLWGDNKIEELSARAAAVVARNPAVIVTASSALVAAFKKATSSIPIVFATAALPVEQGFVASLSRPGGNITGVLLHIGLTAKIVEITREALPKVKRLAILIDDNEPIHKAMLEDFEPNARRLKVEPVVVRISSAKDVERVFKELADRKVEALYLPSLSLLGSLRYQLVERALKARLPLLSSNPTVVEAGGLLSYGTQQEENFRRAAALVDKILRGAKPGDLPVEQPERFQLVVNLKTAKAIGVTLSPATMLRADRVIE